MDYKKKYEQAMLRMNKWVEGSEITDPKEVAEFVFPELKEPEDERIRKELIKVFEEKVQHCFEWKNGIPNNAVIAWLEKQGEQKPAWSEEDELMLNKAISSIKYALSIPADKEDDPCFAGSSTIAWLKSLKERMKGE